jgi:hypothetical protein
MEIKIDWYEAIADWGYRLTYARSKDTKSAFNQMAKLIGSLRTYEYGNALYGLIYIMDLLDGESLNERTLAQARYYGQRFFPYIWANVEYRGFDVQEINYYPWHLWSLHQRETASIIPKSIH